MNAATPAQILLISDILPGARGSDTDLHLMQMLTALPGFGYRVTLVARDGGNGANCEMALRDLGIEVYAGDDERLNALGLETGKSDWSLAQILRKQPPSIAILAQTFRYGITVAEHYLDLIRKHSPQTRMIVHCEEPSGLRAARRAEITQQLEHYEVAQDRVEREMEAFRRADCVIVPRQREAELLLQLEPTLMVGVVTAACETTKRYEWKTSQSILFEADFSRPGDVDGFVWFLEHLWPRIARQSPAIELSVVGGDDLPPEFRNKLPRVKWFAGRELEAAACGARMFVSPQRFGASKYRILRMIASGLPGVVTSSAAEVAGIDSGSGIVTADSREEFADAAIRVFTNRSVWENLAEKGAETIRTRFSDNVLKEQLAAVLAQAETITPKPAASLPFSNMLVDAMYCEALRDAPKERRIGQRLDAYVQIAEQLLRAGDSHNACRQLRHVFSWLGESIKPTPPLARLLGQLARGYRAQEKEDMVGRCAEMARRCFASQISQSAPDAPAIVARRGAPKISLIVPTYNRLPILQKCLATLQAQTISAEAFEVVLIDDSSSDGTAEAMSRYRPKFRFRYLRQKNSGTGAARRNGVEHASGEYLLLMNDDTIADADLIAQHLRAHANLPSAERWAILGNFEYPAAAARRALTHFLRAGSFMFPQVEMEDGFPYPYSHFITCNLSIRRDAVVQAGSFDATYKLSEDTELGIRLLEMGYGVLYHRAAHAWHDHLPYTVAQLIRRARVYGADYFYMFRRHPRVIKEWAMPLDLAGLDGNTARRIAGYLERNRRDVEAAVAALSKWDAIEFEPILARPREAAHILALFERAVPAIHWFYLFESMLETMVRELALDSGVSQEAAMAVAQPRVNHRGAQGSTG